MVGTEKGGNRARKTGEKTRTFWLYGGFSFLTTIFLLIICGSVQAVQRQVAAGVCHTVGLKSDGTVVAVGENDHGQLDVGSWTDIIHVAAAWDRTVELKADGAVVAVGWNACGQGSTHDWDLDGEEAPVLKGDFDEDGDVAGWDPGGVCRVVLGCGYEGGSGRRWGCRYG